MQPDLPRRVSAEAVGTSLLLVAVVGSGIMGYRLLGRSVGVALLANSIATGAAPLALILTFSPISGAHSIRRSPSVRHASAACPGATCPFWWERQRLQHVLPPRSKQHSASLILRARSDVDVAKRELTTSMRWPREPGLEWDSTFPAWMVGGSPVFENGFRIRPRGHSGPRPCSSSGRTISTRRSD
jgi:hypothetical protein